MSARATAASGGVAPRPRRRRVLRVSALLRTQFLRDLASPAGPRPGYRTESFRMPHPSSLDSLFGLYYGSVILRPSVTNARAIVLHWRAEVAWVWPSYESLHAKYGDSHAECFALPNLRAVLQLSTDHALRLDHGLGEHLTRLGLAKPFVAFAEWSEPLPDPAVGAAGRRKEAP